MSESLIRLIDSLYHFLIIEGYIIPFTFFFHGKMIRTRLMKIKYSLKCLLPLIAMLYSAVFHICVHIMLDDLYFNMVNIETIVNQGLMCIGLYEIIKCTKRFLFYRKTVEKRKLKPIVMEENNENRD